MRLKKEDREGSMNVLAWYHGERLVHDQWRYLMYGRRGVQKVSVPLEDTDGTPTTSEQRTAWWHKTMTDHMVKHIEEQGVALKTTVSNRTHLARGILTYLKALVIFRKKYPLVTTVASTVNYPSMGHIRAYRRDEDLPYIIRRSTSVRPMDLNKISAAINALKPIENEAEQRRVVDERQRLIDGNLNNIQQQKARLIQTEIAVAAWDQDKHDKDIKAVKEWLDAMPSIAKTLNPTINNVLNLLVRQKIIHEGRMSTIQTTKQQITISEKWLAENPPLDGGEEE